MRPSTLNTLRMTKSVNISRTSQTSSRFDNECFIGTLIPVISSRVQRHKIGKLEEDIKDIEIHWQMQILPITDL